LNAEKIAKLFKDDKRIAIPKIYWQYTTESVIVMSFEEGKSITNMDYINSNKIKIKDIADILTDAFNRQIFEFGFVHSDPHPGNLFVRKEKVDGKEMTRLVLLDHGLYRDLDDSFRYNYCLLWRGLITQNKEFLRQSCNALGVSQVELFISVLTSNTYDSIMDNDNRYNSHKQLGLKSKHY
jgi:aarF domain-containing kinase